MTKPGKIAVIVTARNQAKYLGDALTSLVRQSLPATEFLYADDGSDDNSCEIADKFNGVRVLRLKHQGVVKARNAAYAALRSPVRDVPYVLVADGDNLLSFDFLKSAAAALDADKAAAVAYSRIIRLIETPAGHQTHCWRGNSAWDYDALAEANFADSSSLVRREAFEASGKWEDVLNTYWDWWLWLRLTRAGWRMNRLPESEYLLYRSHPAQHSKVMESKRLDAYLWVQQRLPVTLFTPFAPGRPWSLELWRENVLRSGLDLKRAHILIADNTGDPEQSARIVSILRELSPNAWTVLPGDSRNYDDLGLRLNHGMTKMMCRLWRRALRHVEGDILWSLEDDIRIPEGGYSRLVSALRPHVGIVGSPAVSRWRRPLEVMANRLKSADPYDLAEREDHRTDYTGMQLSGVESVGSTSVSSTIIRGSIFRAHAPMLTPNGDDRWYGHEFSLMRRCIQAGREVLCHWDTPVDHMVDGEEGLTVAAWREEMRKPDYYRKPDFSQITVVAPDVAKEVPSCA